MSKATAAAKAAETIVDNDTLAAIVPLAPSEIWARDGGVKLNTFEVIPPADTPFENLLRPDFWSGVAFRMKLGDKIIAMPRDGAWYAELLVWDAGQSYAHVRGSAVERPELPATPGVEAQFVIFTDPIDGVCIKRRATGEVVKRNFPNTEDARRWIMDQQRLLRR